MRSDVGAIYHAPEGTYQKSPNDISNENNFSMYTALKMLDGVLKEQSPSASRKLREILKGQQEYFKRYAFDPVEGIFYQGGFYTDGVFVPNISLGLPVIFIGQQLSAQYGSGVAICSILLGNLILWLISLGIISMAFGTRTNAIQNVRFYLGKYGALFTWVIILL